MLSVDRLDIRALFTAQCIDRRGARYDIAIFTHQESFDIFFLLRISVFLHGSLSDGHKLRMIGIY